MSKEERKVPELRFKGFFEDWEQRKLGTISTFYSGGTPSVTNKQYYGGNIPFIRSAEIKSTETELFISNLGLGNSSAKMIDVGNILYALYGATSGEVAISKIKGAINQAIMVINPVPSYDKYFIFYWLEKNKNKIKSTYLQGGQGNLSGSIIKNITLTVSTKKKEQKEIGELLAKLDENINLHQRKLQNLSKIKTLFLRKIIPNFSQFLPELNFKNFEQIWVNHKLGDHAIIKGRLGWKSLKQEEYINEGPGMIAGKHIKQGNINWRNLDHIPLWRYEESPEIKLQNDDVIFTKDGSLGNPAIIKNLKIKATINSTMMLVRTDSSIDSLFFYQIMLSNYFNKLIHLKVSGSSIPHLFQADMKDFSFPIPNISQQNYISEFLQTLDNIIILRQRKISKLEQLKQSYLRKMFL